MKIFENFNRNIGVDLGTVNTLIYLKGRGIVVNEPTIIALNNKTDQIIAIGNSAKRMLDRTPQHINIIRPISGGVISDFEMAEELMKTHLKNLDEGIFNRCGLAVLGVPTNLTEVERKSAEDVLISAGASRVYLVEEPIAAALGARLSIEDPSANMIIDIGGGTTELAIISVGGTVVSDSLKVAGKKFNEDIVKFIKEEFQLAIGEPTAEEIKVKIGSALPVEEKLEMTIRGRDLGSGLPKEVTIKNSHVRLAVTKSLRTIADAAKNLIESAPPELVGDILEKGIHICGGGSLLRGLDRYIEKETTVKTNLIEDSQTCVIRGLGIVVEEFNKYEKLLNSQSKPKEISL
ncbi:MAG: rod shape-determining protein [Candidatus Colwellbacteria bacterium]|nr:rod shape-determining protein [Candidatus Colwellbacteria bacterium]MCK9497467.1 rod shape-determining protein [Candidatus Colwellbacteria bacterium]MDD3752545.1 rod shape-determining protein [Candidatus Colwellbacteria bacterium]MDD4818797.1 rod shape-determining protein [Candidatus Colwellbacteria bacterium]